MSSFVSCQKELRIPWCDFDASHALRGGTNAGNEEKIHKRKMEYALNEKA